MKVGDNPIKIIKVRPELKVQERDKTKKTDHTT